MEQINCFVEYEIIGEIPNDSSCVISNDADNIRKAVGVDVTGLCTGNDSYFVFGGTKYLIFISEAIGEDMPCTFSKLSFSNKDGNRKFSMCISIERNWVNENPNWTSRILKDKRCYDYFNNISIFEISESEEL